MTQFSKLKKLLFFSIFLSGFLVWGNILAADLSIPDSRKADWSYAGVPGGIPERETNCTTAACNTLYGGDVTATTISAAIASAGTNEVVRIPAGTHTISSRVNITRNDVVLRGAGRSLTILDFSGVTDIPIRLGADTPRYWYSWHGYDYRRKIISGAIKGSTSVVLDSVSGITNNMFVDIDEMSHNGNESVEDYVWSPHTVSNTNNVVNQMVIVTNVDSGTNTVSFYPSLLMTLEGDAGMYASTLTTSSANGFNVGIEDLKIKHQIDTAAAIQLYGTMNSWVKNVEIEDYGNFAIDIFRSFRNTVSGCYIHGNVTHNEGYSIALNITSSYNLVENNVIEGPYNGVMGKQDTANVVAYNYVAGNHTDIWTVNQVMAFQASHWPHTMFSLFEGNVGQQFQCDGYHGSCSNVTLFRNKFDGISTIPGMTQNRRMVDLNKYCRFFNVIGNVLGDPSWTPTAYTYDYGDGGSYNTPIIYRLGYPWMGNWSHYDGDGTHGEMPPHGPWTKPVIYVSDPTKVSASASYYIISSTLYWKDSEVITLAGDSVPQNKYGAFAFDLGTDGVYDVVPATGNITGYDTADLAYAALPAVASSHWRSGYATAMNSSGAFIPGTTSLSAANVTALVVGINNDLAAAGQDVDVQNTVLRHRNYDYYNNAVRSCSSESEGCQGTTGDDLPDSLYYSSKPSWWCEESAWPPVNPDGITADLRYSKIPAQRRYEGLSCISGESDIVAPASPTGLSVQ